MQNLGEEVEVRHESSLKDDWDIRSIEQLNWVGLFESFYLPGRNSQFYSESLQILKSEKSKKISDI